MWKISLILSFLAFANHGQALAPNKRRVCVIGAGASGIVSAKRLSMYPDEFEPIVFEKSSDVGGLWAYTDSTTVDEHGLPVHSSIYKYLRINIPKELIKYPDYIDIQGEDVSYVKHQTVLQYLRNYTEHFNVRQYIQFDTNVEQVSPLPGMKWLLVARNLNTKERREITCDAVIVGNGHNVKGNIPKLPGIETFSGRVIHSHIYRKPEEFANQTVVVLGASFSGIDIGIEITKFAKTVYLSHRHDKLPVELPSNMVQVPGVVAAENDQLILSDGSRIKADSLVLCTGYVYDFPFLDASSGIVVDGKYVRYVYKHFINIERPTMAIMNLPFPGVPLVMPHPQVQYFIAVLRGQVKLPSREEMLKDAQLPPGTPKSKAHYMLLETLPYYNDLALAAGDDPLPDYFKAAAEPYARELLGNPLHFREKNLHIYEDGSVEFVPIATY